MGRSQDLSYFHKEFIMPGHYGKMMKNEEMKRKKKGAEAAKAIISILNQR
jgi:hypothetical protein